MIAKTWNELRDLVGQWSVANFGTQHGLGCLAPLLGIVEEGCFELPDSLRDEDKIDALGDVAIFLMDFCYRLGIDIDDSFVSEWKSHNERVRLSVGKLCQVMLKRIQRIRGMDDDEWFNTRVTEVSIRVLAAVDAHADRRGFKKNALQIACDTFEKVVSKRKWHDNPSVHFNEQQFIEDFRPICAELNRGVPQ